MIIIIIINSHLSKSSKSLSGPSTSSPSQSLDDSLSVLMLPFSLDLSWEIKSLKSSDRRPQAKTKKKYLLLLIAGMAPIANSSIQWNIKVPVLRKMWNWWFCRTFLDIFILKLAKPARGWCMYWVGGGEEGTDVLCHPHRRLHTGAVSSDLLVRFSVSFRKSQGLVFSCFWKSHSRTT